MDELNMNHVYEWRLDEEDWVKIISSIPIIGYDKEKHIDHDSCSICIGEYEDSSRVKMLTCKHLFHENCIDEWIMKGRDTNIVCPVCWTDLQIQT